MLLLENPIRMLLLEFDNHANGYYRAIKSYSLFFLLIQEQYIFIHDAILESVMCGDTEINATNLRSTLMKMNRKNNSTKLETQFKVQRELLTIKDQNNVASFYRCWILYHLNRMMSYALLHSNTQIRIASKISYLVNYLQYSQYCNNNSHIII